MPYKSYLLITSHPLSQHMFYRMPSKYQPVLGLEYMKINKTNFQPTKINRGSEVGYTTDIKATTT